MLDKIETITIKESMILVILIKGIMYNRIRL